ncbi:MAG: DUF4437 domain-containing protein [Acidobacteria bacterium]|nr:DUF4437 domain-containing protein [Acidobacteriota bacterium]
MGRPHIEPLVDTDVPRRSLPMPGWKSGVQVRTLSLDPVNGACTQIVEFGGGFRQPAGFSTSEWELFVLDGTLHVGDEVLRKDHYLFVPAGHRVGAISTREGCRAIWFFNDHYPDWVAAEGHRDRSVDTALFTSVNANDTVRWTTPSFAPQTEPGIFIKLLRLDEKTGAFTGLYNMCPGFWQDNVSFHDCMEEAYHIWGESWMLQFGYLPTGGYFYRPPYINHGPFRCEYGTYAIFRTDSWLVNHFNWNPFTTPDECRVNVIETMRKRQPDLMKWVFLHAGEFIP